MIHSDPKNGRKIERLHGEAFEGLSGYVKVVTDGNQDCVVITIPYFLPLAEGLIKSMQY